MFLFCLFIQKNKTLFHLEILKALEFAVHFDKLQFIFIVLLLIILIIFNEGCLLNLLHGSDE